MDIENNLLDYSIEKQSNKNLQKWENNIFKFSYLLTTIVILVELIFYFFFSKEGIMYISFKEYCSLYILRPFIISSLACIIATFLYRRVKTIIKNVFPLCLVVTLVSTFVIVHYQFPCLYPMYIVPVFVSTIYGNIKIERIILGISYIELAFSWFYILKTATNDIPNNFNFYMVLTFIILGLVHVLAQKIILYQNENTKIIKNAILYSDSLRESILHDGLTKIHNHTAFTIYLEKLLEEENKDIYLSIIDIDFFKKVNDTYGHEIGNIVLQKLAEILSQNLDEDNMFLARYGGEEFVMIFKNISSKEVCTFLEDKRKFVEKYLFEEMNNKNITFSAGLTSYKNELMGDFINKADKLLYKAKNNGRNQICKEI